MLDYKHLVQTGHIISTICRRERCPMLDFSGWVKTIEWSVITVMVVCHAGKLMTTFSLSLQNGFHIVNIYCNRKDLLLYFKPPPGWQTSMDHSHANWDNLCPPVFYWESECRLEERLRSTLLSSNDILLCSQYDNTWNTFPHHRWSARFVLNVKKSAVFSPCFHVWACLHCATQCNQCPICRVPILKIKKNHFVKPLLCFGVHLIRERWRGAFGFYSVPEHWTCRGNSDNLCSVLCQSRFV